MERKIFKTGIIAEQKHLIFSRYKTENNLM